MSRIQRLFHNTSHHFRHFREGVGGRGRKVLPSGLAQLGKGSGQVLVIVREFLCESFIS